LWDFPYCCIKNAVLYQVFWFSVVSVTVGVEEFVLFRIAVDPIKTTQTLGRCHLQGGGGRYKFQSVMEDFRQWIAEKDIWA
jgi:hypothetical protein